MMRPYQLEVVRAIVGSVRGKRGLSFSVEMARQSGKNEISTQVEALLLSLYYGQARDGVKCAPTFEPQCRISLRDWWTTNDGRKVRSYAVALAVAILGTQFVAGAGLVGYPRARRQDDLDDLDGRGKVGRRDVAPHVA